MTYYKDFPESNIRLIVLDLYYDIEIQGEWLKNILEEAKEKGLCVITATHEPTAEVFNTFDVTFHAKNDYPGLLGTHKQKFLNPLLQISLLRVAVIYVILQVMNIMMCSDSQTQEF